MLKANIFSIYINIFTHTYILWFSGYWKKCFHHQSALLFQQQNTFSSVKGKEKTNQVIMLLRKALSIKSFSLRIWNHCPPRPMLPFVSEGHQRPAGLGWCRMSPADEMESTCISSLCQDAGMLCCSAAPVAPSPVSLSKPHKDPAFWLVELG